MSCPSSGAKFHAQFTLLNSYNIIHISVSDQLREFLSSCKDRSEVCTVSIYILSPGMWPSQTAGPRQHLLLMQSSPGWPPAAWRWEWVGTRLMTRPCTMSRPRWMCGNRCSPEVWTDASDHLHAPWRSIRTRRINSHQEKLQGKVRTMLLTNTSFMIVPLWKPYW